MQEDSKIKDFIEKYKTLCKEYQIELIAYPQFNPTDKGTFELSCVIIPIERKESKPI